MRGRAAIVTGAGSGIGRAIAARLVREGALVVLADVREEAAGEAAAAIGGRALPVRADVTDGRDVDAIARAAEDAFGAVDVLVNNAYSCDADDVLATDEAAWRRDLDGTLTGAFLCTRRVLPGMVERGRGAIVNIASVNGLAAFGNEAYSAAKAGLISLTQNLAVRYGRQGIRVNAIAPGTVRTPAWSRQLARDPALFEKLARWYPLGRVGEPDDVAAAVLFLASDEASWITGVTLRVDGGLMAGNPTMTEELV